MNGFNWLFGQSSGIFNGSQANVQNQMLSTQPGQMIIYSGQGQLNQTHQAIADAQAQVNAAQQQNAYWQAQANVTMNQIYWMKQGQVFETPEQKHKREFKKHIDKRVEDLLNE